MTEETNGPIRVLLVSGTVRPDSFTRASVEKIASSLENLGAITNIWDLATEPLPIADPQFHWNPEDSPNPGVQKLSELAYATDAWVLASPVYHNSYSGVLKNFLDIVSIPQMAHKAVGLVGQGGNRTSQAVDHLRIVTRGLNGVAIPTQVCTDRIDFTTDNQGKHTVVEPMILERIERFTSELIAFAGYCRDYRKILSANAT